MWQDLHRESQIWPQSHREVCLYFVLPPKANLTPQTLRLKALVFQTTVEYEKAKD